MVKTTGWMLAGATAIFVAGFSLDRVPRGPAVMAG